MGLQGSSRCLYALSEQRDGPSWNAGGEGGRETNVIRSYLSAYTYSIYRTKIAKVLFAQLTRGVGVRGQRSVRNVLVPWSSSTKGYLQTAGLQTPSSSVTSL